MFVMILVRVPSQEQFVARFSGEGGEATWEVPAVATGMSAAESYRCGLVEDGKTPAAKANQAGFSQAESALGKKRQGQLSRGELLRCRVRNFSDGLVLGS
ncbi:MAG: hypothetical protein NTW21_22800 [Verrucomicrobia bacterium]|nr:hypothetical protein [Verrucomicrobiota bacterium]